LKKIVFLIRSLNVGGAERQLLTLLQTLDRREFEPVVVSFYSKGTLFSEFINNNIPVQSASKNGRWDIVLFLIRLVKIIRNEKPDIVVSYLVAANLLAVLLKPILKPGKIVISIRHSFLRKEDYDWLSALLYAVEDRIARWSDLIILNSFVGARQAHERGISKDNMVVIPNGINTIQFHPDVGLRKKKRAKLNIENESIVVGLVGRLDPVKNHIGFIEAASLLKDEAPQVRFLIIGDGPEEYRQVLSQNIQESCMEDRFQLIPAEIDPVTIYNAMDICVSSSIGEGFSNVIAEAMACEIPCVVTDVGDSACIVGQTGRVVPVGDTRTLAEAILSLVNMEPGERQKLGQQAREKIISEFSIEKMVVSTMQEFEKLG